MGFRRRRLPRSQFGAAVYAIRRRLNLNQEQLARIIGCDRSTVCQYELGRSKAGIGRLVRLLRLAETEHERQTVLKALERIGVSAFDLAGPLVDHPPTVPVSGLGTQEATSQVQSFSGIGSQMPAPASSPDPVIAGDPSGEENGAPRA